MTMPKFVNFPDNTNEARCVNSNKSLKKKKKKVSVCDSESEAEIGLLGILMGITEYAKRVMSHIVHLRGGEEKTQKIYHVLISFPSSVNRHTITFTN